MWRNEFWKELYGISQLVLQVHGFLKFLLRAKENRRPGLSVLCVGVQDLHGNRLTTSQKGAHLPAPFFCAVQSSSSYHFGGGSERLARG